MNINYNIKLLMQTHNIQQDENILNYTNDIIKTVLELVSEGTDVKEYYGLDKVDRSMVDLEIDWDDDELLEFMLLAHRRNITLNRLVHDALLAKMVALNSDI
jgi:hypothetical protein